LLLEVTGSSATNLRTTGDLNSCYLQDLEWLVEMRINWLGQPGLTKKKPFTCSYVFMPRHWFVHPRNIKSNILLPNLYNGLHYLKNIAHKNLIIFLHRKESNFLREGWHLKNPNNENFIIGNQSQYNEFSYCC